MKCKHKNIRAFNWGRSYTLKFRCKDCGKEFTRKEVREMDSHKTSNTGEEKDEK